MGTHLGAQDVTPFFTMAIGADTCSDVDRGLSKRWPMTQPTLAGFNRLLKGFNRILLAGSGMFVAIVLCDVVAIMFNATTNVFDLNKYKTF